MKPIFIGGTGRSGTTVLKHVLAAHPRIASLPFELRLIIDPGGVLDLINTLSDRWSPYNADIAIRQFQSLALDCASTSLLRRGLAKGLSSLGVSPWRYTSVGIGDVVGKRYYHRRVAELVQSLTWHTSHGNWAGTPQFQFPATIYEAAPYTRESVSSILGQFIEDLFAAVPRLSPSRDLANQATAGQERLQPDRTHWIDDTPYNILHAGELLSLFPEMRLVHIYRDPRDVIVSYRGKAWGGDNLIVSARRVAGILERWSIVREGLPQECFMEIALEELSANPQPHLRRICDFIGLPYEPALENVPLNRVNAGRWQRDLSVDEQQLAQQILNSVAPTPGYSKNAPDITVS